MRVLIGIVLICSLACGYSSKLQSHTELTKAWIAKKEHSQKATKGVDTPDPSLIKYYVYTRVNAESPQILEPDVESVVRNVYNPLKPTVFSVHGWGGSIYSPENYVIVTTKLAEEDCNVIVVDHNAVPQGEYHEAAAAAPFVGAEIAKLIELLHIHFDVKLSKIHLTGFSMGAQIVGFAGQNVYKSLAQKVLRITGLDPAGPIFNEAQTNDERLSADDAHFVDVIHTNAGGIGYTLPCGHADYYPNGGQVQPGCNPNDISCSHGRAYQLIREMWSKENEFISAKCVTIEALYGGQCRWLNLKMGANVADTGIYFLETNSVYPFAKGSSAFEFF